MRGPHAMLQEQTRGIHPDDSHRAVQNGISGADQDVW